MCEREGGREGEREMYVLCVFVCVRECVCVRERERERETEHIHWYTGID